MTRQMQTDLNREFEASDATAQDVLDLETWLKQANLWPWRSLSLCLLLHSPSGAATIRAMIAEPEWTSGSAGLIKFIDSAFSVLRPWI